MHSNKQRKPDFHYSFIDAIGVLGWLIKYMYNNVNYAE